MQARLCLTFSTFFTGKLRRRQFYSQPLENGKILLQGSTFTYQDVLDELLVYTPDGQGSATDEIRFSVTDGVHTETGRLEFSMDVRKSEGPRVTINRGLQLAAGQDIYTVPQFSLRSWLHFLLLTVKVIPKHIQCG